jgi:hypothetical protein
MDELFEKVKERSAILQKRIEPIINQIVLLYLREENAVKMGIKENVRTAEFQKLLDFYATQLEQVLGC